jgi:hypothetical protein
VPFGAATCTGSAGVPVTACSAPPRFGQLLQVQLGNAPPQAAVVRASGWSYTRYGAVNLPRDLSPFGAAPGCMQWFSLDATVLAVTDAAGTAALPFSIPNVPSLLETTLFHGYYVLDPGAPANPLGVVTTAPVAMVVGV